MPALEGICVSSFANLETNLYLVPDDPQPSKSKALEPPTVLQNSVNRSVHSGEYFILSQPARPSSNIQRILRKSRLNEFQLESCVDLEPESEESARDNKVAKKIPERKRCIALKETVWDAILDVLQRTIA